MKKEQWICTKRKLSLNRNLEGIEEGKIEVAKAMLADNVDTNTIVKFTGLSISEIERIAGLEDTHQLT